MLWMSGGGSSLPPEFSAAPAGARDRDRSRRPARAGRAAATALVVGLALLGAAAAEAQTPVTLVSNQVQTADDSASTSGNDHAQLFQTGAHAAGYTFTGMHVSSEDAEGDDFDVEICEEDGSADEFPSSTCTALTAPASFAAGLLFFDHTGLALSANTNYVVVIKQRGTGSVELNSTPSGAEDTIGLSDWSIKDTFYWNNSGTWTVKSGANEALRIIVYGYAVTVDATDATLSALSVSGATLSPAFAKQTTAYKTEPLANSVSRVTISSTTSQSGTTIAYLNRSLNEVTDADTGTSGFQLDLTTGTNTIRLETTAPDELTTNAYTIKLLRIAAPAACSAASMLNQIWTAQMTVGLALSLGFIEGDDGYLNNKTITYSGTSHTVGTVSVIDFFGLNNLYFGLANSNFGIDAADLVLHVDDKQYGLGDATLTTNRYAWDSNLPSFANGDGVCLALTVDGPAVTSVEFTSTPPNPAYAIGGVVETTVNFSAAVDITGTPQLELDFDGTAKAASCAAATNTTTMACSYTVLVGDTAPNGVAIAADKLTLNGGTITATGSTTIDADLDHDAVAIDAGHKVDGIRPTLVTTGTDAPRTSTDGTQVILTFSEDISAVTLGSISLEANATSGYEQGATVSRSGRTVTLTLLSPSLTIAAGWTVTVELSADAVDDAAGNGNLALAATTVTNAVGSTTAPTVTGIALTSSPQFAAYGRGEDVEATVTFDAAVDISGSPQLELDFDGTAKAAACAAATNTTTMVCSYRVATGDSAPNGIAIEANKLTGGTITATGSTTAADLDHSAVAIDADHKVDGIRPTLVTTGTGAPTTSTDGTKVILTFSEDIRPVNRNLITIQANGATLSTTAADRTGNKAEITLATALTAAATNLTVALASNSVFDVAGNGILAVAATAVSNAVDSPDPPGTLKARRGDGEVHLEWVPVAAVPTDPDLAYQLRYGTEGGESSQWRDIPRSAPGGPNARSYTVTGLQNGTRYAFALRVRRGSGFGTAAEIRQTPEAPRWSVSTNRRSVHEGEDVTLSIATRNAVGFYSAPEALTLAVIGQIVLESDTIDGADPEDYEIRVDGTTVRGYTKDITFLNFDSDPDREPFPAQHFDVEVPVGSTSLDVTVTVLADGEEEDGQEHMSFMVFRGEELVNEDTWDGTGVNIESGDAGVVKQLAVADAEATEGEDPSLDFVVTLAPAAAWTVTVDYATHAGTARAGADYTHTSGALTFAPGDTEKTVSVPVIDDTVQDTPETLTVRLSNADPPYVDSGNVVWGSREAGVLIADAVATGTIRNTEDQAEPPAVSVSDASAAEGDAVVFTVSLSAASSQQVTVDYATADGTATAGEDYTATSGTLTFQAGETEKTVSVPVIDDTEDDGGETFTLTLSNASGADLGDAEATGTIRDTETAAELSADFPESAFTSKRHTGSDDRPQVVVTFSEPVASFDRNTPSVSVTGASGLSVQAHTEDGLENAYMFFMTPDGNSDVTFALVADAACASGGICTTGGTVLTQVPASWTIPGPSGDTSSLSVADAEATEEEDSTMDFVVTLDPAASDTVTVDYATSDGTAAAGEDYTATSGTLTFTAGEVTKTISVPITDEAEDDGGETFTLTLSNASGAEIEDATATGTFRDTDTTATPLTASFKNLPATHDGSSEVTFQVEFSEDVGISYAVLRDDGFAVTKGDVTGARRVNGRNDLWQITVEPDGRDDVTITLPGHRNCGTTGAVCTRGDDPRPLSHSPSATVAGPPVAVETTPTVSISGGSGKEGDDSSVSFTVTLDEAATGTVTVDYATSDGTADAGDDYTAKSGTLSFSAGQTSKTISIAISDDIENESDETFTVTLSNASGADIGTSAATGTIRNRRVTPLTASFEGVPAEHDGESVFTFRLRFSEDPAVSYMVLRDEAFSVTGGAVQAARRVDGRNDLREIHVEPDPDGLSGISIALPATTDCAAADAICTADGRPLSHSLSATVAGPVGISVGDARVEEGDGAVLSFAVTLSRAASGALTVDYATSDGSAQAGVDYTGASGTLTFQAGESSRTIEVTVLDDSHDDDGETLTLTLSNPSPGRLTDAEATGTIKNSDPLPRALMARFGRTAAVHVVEHVEERIEAPRQPGFRGQFAGRELRRGMEREMALSFLSRLGGSAGAIGYGVGGHDPMAGSPGAGVGGMGSLRTPGLVRGGVGMPGAGGTVGANARMRGAGTGAMGGAGMLGGAPGPMSAAAGADGGLFGGGLHSMGLGGDNLLTGSAFAMNRESHGGMLSFWSRGTRSHYAGREGTLGLSGDVRTTMFGADYAKGPVVAGLSLSHSRGLGEYAGVAAGQVASAVTGLYPWLGYKATDRVTVWGVAGYGRGGLLLTPDSGSALESGLSMAMAAAGTRGELIAGGAGGFALAFKADALWVGTAIDGVDGPAGRLKATDAAVTRFRTGLEGSRAYTPAGRLSLRPSVEVGLRHDGGDAETGAGMDVGAGLIVSDASTGLAVDVRVRTLLMHQAEGFRERGMALSLSYNPTPSTPLGFTARVAPSWGGQAQSGAEALWGRETMAGVAHGGLASGNRLDGEVGYGLPVGSRFVGTPRVGFSASEYGRDYRVGYGLGVLDRGNVNFELGVDAQRRESPMEGGTSNGFLGRARLGW